MRPGALALEDRCVLCAGLDVKPPAGRGFGVARGLLTVRNFRESLPGYKSLHGQTGNLPCKNGVSQVRGLRHRNMGREREPRLLTRRARPPAERGPGGVPSVRGSRSVRGLRRDGPRVAPSRNWPTHVPPGSRAREALDRRRVAGRGSSFDRPEGEYPRRVYENHPLRRGAILEPVRMPVGSGLSRRRPRRLHVEHRAKLDDL